MNWIQRVTTACQENEAPEVFFYWASLAAIAASVKKQIFLNRFYYRLYPNIYVFLVAKSGMKKGVPIVLAKTLVEHAKSARVVSGRNSMPRIILDLSKARTIEGGGIVKNAQCLMVSGELASFLVRDPDALTILTDLHDTHAYEKEWTNSLKGTGVDVLHEPCITLLGATNEEHFADAVPANAIGGGFIARTFIIYSTLRGQLNSLTQRPQNTIDIAALAKDLERISKVKGEFKWGEGAIETYDAWYYPFMREDHHDPTGTMNRMGDQILKVAMLLSLADDDKLVLHPQHVKEAIAVSLDCVSGVRQITMGAGKSNLALQTKSVLRELIIRPDHQIERQKLLQKFWGDMDAFDLDKIIETLQGAGAIEVVRHGKKTILILKEEALKQYTAFKSSIQ